MDVRARSGVALLLVTGILGMLGLLAVAFSTLARLERRASLQRVQETRAQLLARSGVEDAVARVVLGQEGGYGGEDWNGSGALDPLEAAGEVLRPGTLDTEDCPARLALRPSFFVRSPGSPDPLLETADGRPRGVSGRLGGAYAVRVLDPGGFFVNGGDLSVAGEGVPGDTYNTVLKRILGTLAQELGPPLVQADGIRLVTFRPAGGWRSFEQIRTLALGGSAAKLEALRPYLALEAWVDRKVVRPNIHARWAPPPSGWFNVETATAWAEIKVGQRDATSLPFGHLANLFLWNNTGMISATGNVGNPWTGKRQYNARTASYAPDFERGASGAVVGRAPVSLEWARSRPAALKALLQGLKGVRADLEMQWMQNGATAAPLHLEREEGGVATLYESALSPAEADAVAAALGAHAGFPTWVTEFPDWDRTASIDTWDEFSRFVDLKLGFLQPDQRDLVKANFNPNTASNKFNPGETVWKRLDKTDLTGYSTEFALRNPVRAVSACGRVVDAGGRVLAERTVSAEVRLRQVRLTAQSEFCAGDLGRLDEAGDESGFRLPGDAGFLAESSGTEPTFGCRFPGSPRGLALQTYPEPQWPGSPCPAPADWDGSLQLATLDADPAASPGLRFLAGYDDGYDADVAAGSAACLLDERHGPPSASLLGSGPVGSKAILNQVYPDGTYSETYRAPGYEARGNLGDGYRGILSFWYRPSYGSAAGCQFMARRQTPFLLNLVDVDPRFVASIYPSTQVLEVGLYKAGGNQCMGVLLENRVDHMLPEDDHQEDGPIFGWMWSTAGQKTFEHAHRWMLVTAQWNVEAKQSSQFGYFQVNGTSHLATSSGLGYYAQHLAPNHGNPDGGGIPAATKTCLTRDCFREDGSLGSPLFFLGERGVQSSGGESPADGTIDDLMILTATTDLNEGKLFAAARHRAGRFHKEDAAPGAYGAAPCGWTSAPLRLGEGARVLRADWTLVLPREIRGPASVPDLWPSPNRIYYGTGVDRVNGETADAAMTPRDAAGAPLVPAPLRNGTSLDLAPSGGVLRLGMDLRPRLGDNAGAWGKLTAPLLESPVLDDLTLLCCGPEGPALRGWTEGGSRP